MDAGGGAHANLNGNVPPPFLSKTYDMVDDPSTDEIVSWSPGNNSFIVWNPPEIAKELLPKYFKHNNFSSFVRQLNTYGFRKIDPDRWEFANEGFLRSQKHLLKGIQRRKPNHTHVVQQMPQGQRATSGRCVEVGKFGLEEEVERLKRDKNVLMQELVRLRQQQQTTDNQLQTVLQRFQGMEQRQQQMMSFLAKAVQSPSFLAQFMQPNDAKQRVAGVSKKRRLPKQEDVSVAVNLQSEGQIIKYQPIMNDAAKALFMQMLGMESAAALQPTINGPESPDSFFVGASPSAPADQDSSSSLASCVTFAEMNPHSGIPSHPTPCFQDVTSIPKNNSPISGIPLNLTGNGIHGMQDSSNPCEAVLDIPELSELTGMVPENGGLDIANLAYPSPKLENGSFDPLSVDGADGAVPLDLDSFSAEADGALMFDETSPLPDIDGFWDHLFTASPHSSEIEDLESTSHGSRRNENGSGVYGENRYYTAGMDQLTHQMGLLRSEQK